MVLSHHPKNKHRSLTIQADILTEALAPVEIGSPSFRVINYDEEANLQGLETNLDLLDEVRSEVVTNMDKYKEKTREYFGKWAEVKTFLVGYMVNRETEASDPQNTGKLMPKWEGPYKIAEILRPGSYKLAKMDGTEVNNTWHGDNLRKYYQ